MLLDPASLPDKYSRTPPWSVRWAAQLQYRTQAVRAIGCSTEHCRLLDKSYPLPCPRRQTIPSRFLITCSNPVTEEGNGGSDNANPSAPALLPSSPFPQIVFPPVTLLCDSHCYDQASSEMNKDRNKKPPGNQLEPNKSGHAEAHIKWRIKQCQIWIDSMMKHWRT